MSNKLQNAWYSHQKWVWVLLPLTIIFACLSALRRICFKLGLFSVYKSKLPVIIVGNIGIGGNGKTPLVLSLVDALEKRAYKVAVLSRGYGGNQSNFPYQLNKNDKASLVGDEPALIKQRAQCYVVIDPKRARGAQYIEKNTDADVIICDDGLQHYALGRDIELCVIDMRGLGNAHLLPMGPLREGAWRLACVDAVVHNLGMSHRNEIIQLSDKPDFAMHLKAVHWVNLKTSQVASLDEFAQLAGDYAGPITAMAGIGDPKRFFDTLDKMKIKSDKQLSFADHYHFSSSDIPQASMVIMTEKDAIKCCDFAHDDCWYLAINASLSEEFFQLINAGLDNHKILKDIKTV